MFSMWDGGAEDVEGPNVITDLTQSGEACSYFPHGWRWGRPDGSTAHHTHTHTLRSNRERFLVLSFFQHCCFGALNCSSSVQILRCTHFHIRVERGGCRCAFSLSLFFPPCSLALSLSLAHLLTAGNMFSQAPVQRFCDRYLVSVVTSAVRPNRQG